MNELLDYASWSFQLVLFLVVLYLVIGLIKPSWVLASKRSTIVLVSVVVMLIAATAFIIAIRPLDSAPDGSAQVAPAAESTTPAP